MDKLRFCILYLGRLEFQKLHLIECENETERIKSPMFAILIQHPTLGNLLYDTGNSPFYTAEYSKEILDTYPMADFVSIEDALAEKGLKPSDIDQLILSHMHFDHVGGLRYFSGTKAFNHVLVAEEELKNAYFSVMTGCSGAYEKVLFDVPGVRYETIRETTKLADDLILFIQNSHTPGVIGMQLKTESRGTVLAVSDTLYARESYDLGLPPGGKINKTRQEFFDHLERIRRMERDLHATILFGHDYAQAMDWIQQGWIS